MPKKCNLVLQFGELVLVLCVWTEWEMQPYHVILFGIVSYVVPFIQFILARNTPLRKIIAVNLLKILSCF